MSFIAPMPDSTDLSQRLLAQLRFPCGDVPEPGDIKKVAPGIFWLRMPLPFQLNHINLWLVEEANGWTIVDTGINTEATRDLWDRIFAERLGGKPVVRVIATHLGLLPNERRKQIAAAYNAGPEAARRWLQRYPHSDPDLFVERIPYKETRLYVKKVMRNFAIYKTSCCWRNNCNARCRWYASV